ncbi:MAG: ATP-binding protein [Candidatus Margulisiibacteriota bacterium]|jgi:hypothetical protein
MIINRILFEAIKNKLITGNKIVILYGPRQVGKTTLVVSIVKSLGYKALSVNADEKKYTEIFASRDLNKLKAFVAGYELLFIDEAQRIPDIGINLKILHDQLPNLKIIATGSSSFELANKIKEPLTGRTWTFQLFPIAVQELANLYNRFEINDRLEDLLIYGGYPELNSIPNSQDKKQYLKELSESYLYKDVLEISSIKHSNKLHDLLRLLAFQIGSQVSLSEIGNNLGINKETVAYYIDLLEKSFVIFRLRGFSRNLRKEIAKSDKIFFYDLGVRNAIIDNFYPLSQRADAGPLWENFLIAERKKLLHYSFDYVNQYFWRLYTGAEIDYIEEKGDFISAFEFKFSSKIVKPPKSWLETYPKSSFSCINKDNYLDFIIN